MRNHEHTITAYRIISTSDLQSGMDFPARLSLAAFSQGLHALPLRHVYLMQERTKGTWAGVVVVWRVPELEGWWQILYGVLPQCRGRRLAQEAGGALLRRLFREPSVRGVLALVRPTNLASVAVLDRMGLTLHRSGPFLEFQVDREAFLAAHPENALRAR